MNNKIRGVYLVLNEYFGLREDNFTLLQFENRFLNDSEPEQHTQQDVESHDVDEHRVDEGVTGAEESVDSAASGSVLQQNLLQQRRQSGREKGLQRSPEDQEGGLHDEEGGEELVEEERERRQSAEENVEVMRRDPGEHRSQEGEGGESVVAVVARLGVLRLNRTLKHREADREKDRREDDSGWTVRHLPFVIFTRTDDSNIGAVRLGNVTRILLYCKHYYVNVYKTKTKVICF